MATNDGTTPEGVPPNGTTEEPAATPPGAITGLETPGGSETIVPDAATEAPVNPARSAMADIIAKRRAQVAEELLPLPPDQIAALAGAQPPASDDAPPSDGVQVPAGSAPAQVPAAGTPGAPPVAGQPGTAPSETKSIKIKVNGRDVLVSQDEYDALAQKGLSAEERYQDAARLRREAETIVRTGQIPGVAAAPAGQASVPTTPAAVDLDYGEIVDTIQTGTKEEASAALKKLVEASRGPTGQADGLTPEELEQRTSTRVLQTIQFRSDLETFGKDFNDVISNAGLTYIAAQYAHQIRQRDAANGINGRPNLEVFTEAGNLTRDWAKNTASAMGFAAAPTPNPGDPPTPPANTPRIVTSEERTERKRGAQNPPAGANIRVPAKPTTPVAVRPSDVVAKMRTARGQG